VNSRLQQRLAKEWGVGSKREKIREQTVERREQTSADSRSSSNRGKGGDCTKKAESREEATESRENGRQQ
jgi:hypothetical protein